MSSIDPTVGSGVLEDPQAEAPPPSRRLLGDVVIYGSGRVALQLVTFLAVPVVTRIFTPADYGVIETTATLTIAIALLASLGLDSATQRSYFDYGDRQERERVAVLSTGFWMLLASTVVCAIVVASISRPVSALLFGDHRYTSVLAFAIAGGPALAITSYFQEILRVRHRPVPYSVLSVFAGAVAIALALFFAGVQDLGLRGYYIGLLVGTSIAACVGFFMVRDAVRPIVDRRQLRIMLAFGLPLLPVAASSWILQLADRFFLLHFSPLTEVGLYAVAVRLSNVLMLGVAAFAIAWSPLAFDLSRNKPEEERRLRSRVLTYVTLVLCFGALILSVFAREFFLTVTPSSYERAYQAVGLLCGSVVALGINGVTMTGISLERKTGYFARYALYTALLNIGLNFLLIPPWGMVGAGLATFVTYAVLAVLYYRRAQVVHRAPFEERRLVLTAATTGVLIAVGTFVNLNPVWLSVLAKVPLVLAFPVALRLVGVLDRNSVRILRGLVSELVGR